MKKNAIRIGVSVALMVILLAFFFWNVDLGEVVAAVEQADLWLIVMASLTALFSYWLRAVRWQFILRPVGRTTHLGTVLAVAVGYAAMTLLPARMGEKRADSVLGDARLHLYRTSLRSVDGGPVLSDLHPLAATNGAVG